MLRTVYLLVILFGCFFPTRHATTLGQNTHPSLRCRDSSSVCRVNESVSDSAATWNRESCVPKWYEMITKIPGDWVEYSDNTFRAKNLPAIVGISALTAGLILTDRSTYWTEKKWYENSRTFREASDLLTFTGDGRFQFGIVGMFAAYGIATGDSRALRTASQITEAILACGGVVQLLKHITGRESPYVATEPTGAWRFFPNQIDYAKHVPHYDAFPSGHIATAMTTLIVISENYPEVTWLRPAGYVALGAISSSLVATGIHWWSDIPLGLALGYAFGEIASHPREIKLGNEGPGIGVKITLSPAPLPKGGGLALYLRF